MIICPRFQANDYAKICVLLQFPTSPEATEKLLAMMLMRADKKHSIVSTFKLQQSYEDKMIIVFGRGPENVAVVMNPIDHPPAGVFHFSLAQYKQNIIA